MLYSCDRSVKSHHTSDLLVESISPGRSQQEARAEVRITYRFGSPPEAASESED
jgi:hypothetical protein